MQEQQATMAAVDELTDRLDEDWLPEWKKLEDKAMEERGEALRIFDVTDVKGKCLNACPTINVSSVA